MSLVSLNFIAVTAANIMVVNWNHESLCRSNIIRG